MRVARARTCAISCLRCAAPLYAGVPTALQRLHHYLLRLPLLYAGYCMDMRRFLSSYSTAHLYAPSFLVAAF